MDAGAENVLSRARSTVGVALGTMDGSGLGSKQQVMEALAVAMRFPDYFGRNWDAVDECLGDMSWWPAQGYVLCVERAESLWAAAPLEAGRLVEAWLFSADRWRLKGVAFHLVFVMR
jgi:hypothetical protein